MPASARARKRSPGAGWAVTLLGVGVMIVGGFAAGVLVGILSEEPELVVGHVAGRSSEIDWSAGAEPGEPAEALAAAPEASAEPRAEATPPARPAPVRAAAASAPPAPERRLPSVAAPPAPPSHSWAVQVGAFGASESAERIAGRLRKGGYAVFVLSPTNDDRWRVRVGPLASEAEAERVARRLKSEESLPTWVLRERDQ